MDPRLKKISLPCYRKDDVERKHKLARCLRMKKGCSQMYAWPRQKAQILAHAADCLYLAEVENMADVIEGINLSMGTEAPSVKLANMKRKYREPPDAAAPKKPRIDQGVGIGSTVADGPSLNLSKSSVDHPQKFKADSDLQPSVVTLSRKAKAEQITLQLDLDVLTIIVISGVPPSIIDLPAWKNMWLHAVPNYTPTSATRLVDYLLPRECSRVRTIQQSQLRKLDNLTLTFDGNSTRKQDSIYTIHIITPDRVAYLFEGNSQSNKSHDADHLWSVV